MPDITKLDKPELVNHNTNRDETPLTLAEPLSSTATTMTLNQAVKDKDGNAITGKIKLSVKTDDAYEIITVPAGDMTSTGVCTNLIRGGVPSGLDIDAQDISNYAFAHFPDDEVSVVVDYSHLLQLFEALLGTIATGGLDFIIGNETDGTVSIKHAKSGVVEGFIRKLITAAFLTGGNSAESVFGTWAAVTDGSFRVTLNGVAYNIDAINFTGDLNMDDVAETIQDAIRTATGNTTEIVTWDTDHFIINSDPSDTSAITVLSTSTGTVGTDISGAGAADWLDADIGNGVVTAFVKKVQYSNDGSLFIDIDAAAPVNITTRVTTTAAANNGEIFQNSADNNSLTFKDNGGAIIKLVDDTTQTIPQASVDLIKDVTASATNINLLTAVTVLITNANATTLKGGPTSNADTLHTHSLSFAADVEVVASPSATSQDINDDTIITCGFLAKTIVLDYDIIATGGGADTFANGQTTFDGITERSGLQINANVSARSSVSPKITSIGTVGGGGTSDAQVNISIVDITDTTFKVRIRFRTGSAYASGAKNTTFRVNAFA